MFYEKLAEAKEEKKRKGLSTGQKIGVGGTGLLGYAMSSRRYKPLFSWEDSRLGHDLLISGRDNKLRDLDLADIIVADGKRAGTFHADGTPDYKAALRSLRVGDTAKTPNSGLRSVTVTDGIKEQLDRLLEAEDPWTKPVKRKLADEYSTAASKARNELDRKTLTRKRIRHGIVGLTAGYGAKKLFDRYNARKQERN
jgi:hypothetical protein